MTETGHIRSNGSHRRERKKETSTTLLEYDFIDYERPLMENLGTLLHNERHVVQKPAGILNSIAVPLMTYSSSLEKGTVFAAADPAKTYDLPFVPFIETTSQHERKAYKRYTNVKAITHSGSSNVKISTAPNLESSVKEFIKTTEPIHRNTLVGKVKPNMKTVEQAPKSHRNYNVSFGLNTLITGNPRKATKDLNVKIPEGPRKLTSKATEERYKNIKQYTNNRLSIHSNKKNVVPLIQNKIISAQGQGTTASLPEADQLDNVKDKNKATDASHTNKYVTLVPTTSLVYNHEDTAVLLDPNDSSAKIDSLATLALNQGSADCDLTFVPYSQYVATVTPESPNAHTGEGTLDYGLPLMNCIGTVFQGKIQSTVKTADDLGVIDVPLMKCLKTLEHASDL